MTGSKATVKLFIVVVIFSPQMSNVLYLSMAVCVVRFCKSVCIKHIIRSVDKNVSLTV